MILMQISYGKHLGLKTLILLLFNQVKKMVVHAVSSALKELDQNVRLVNYFTWIFSYNF